MQYIGKYTVIVPADFQRDRKQNHWKGTVFLYFCDETFGPLQFRATVPLVSSHLVMSQTNSLNEMLPFPSISISPISSCKRRQFIRRTGTVEGEFLHVTSGSWVILATLGNFVKVFSLGYQILKFWQYQFMVMQCIVQQTTARVYFNFIVELLIGSKRKCFFWLYRIKSRKIQSHYVGL